MDRPIHLDASTLEQSIAFADAERNALRRNSKIILPPTDPELAEIVAQAGRDAARRARGGV